jgi:NADPH2:quinone reductase
MAATDGQGVDVILDPVGGGYLARNISLLRPFGRLVNIANLGGSKGELDMGRVLGRRLRIVGSTLRGRSVAEKIAITRKFEAEVWPKLADGRLQPIIDRILPHRRSPGGARLRAGESQHRQGHSGGRGQGLGKNPFP